MRWLVLGLLAACTSMHGDPGHCPVLSTGTDPMTLVGTSCLISPQIVCFEQDDFSTCYSAFYRCVGGKWALDHQLQPTDGTSCAGSPIASCSYEGNPDCATDPTSESCSCGNDGLWHCSCACYGGQTTCSVECPPDYPGAGASGPMCATIGQTCAYAAGSCTCTQGPDGGHFAC